MKGTPFVLSIGGKNSSVVIRFEILLRLFGTFEKLAPGSHFTPSPLLHPRPSPFKNFASFISESLVCPDFLPIKFLSIFTLSIQTPSINSLDLNA